MDYFQLMVEDTKRLVRDRIENKDTRPDYVLEKQLYMILGELDKMEQIRNHRLFYPYYPRGIADCWDFSDPLGAKLLDLLQLYKKLNE